MERICTICSIVNKKLFDYSVHSGFHAQLIQMQGYTKQIDPFFGDKAYTVYIIHNESNKNEREFFFQKYIFAAAKMKPRSYYCNYGTKT